MRALLHFNDESIRRFAEWSADSSSIHTDAQFARHSRFRRPVVHGMLPLCALGLLAAAFPGRALRFKKITGRFISPIFPGEPVAWEASATETTFRAEWKHARNGTRL